MNEKFDRDYLSKLAMDAYAGERTIAIENENRARLDREMALQVQAAGQMLLNLCVDNQIQPVTIYEKLPPSHTRNSVSRLLNNDRVKYRDIGFRAYGIFHGYDSTDREYPYRQSLSVDNKGRLYNAFPLGHGTYINKTSDWINRIMLNSLPDPEHIKSFILKYRLKI